jgi:hypothetical protein
VTSNLVSALDYNEVATPGPDGDEAWGSIHWHFALMLAWLVMLRRKSVVLIALLMVLASWTANAVGFDEMDLYVAIALMMILRMLGSSRWV